MGSGRWEADVRSLATLRAMTDRELLDVRGIGYESVRFIRSRLARNELPVWRRWLRS